MGRNGRQSSLLCRGLFLICAILVYFVAFALSGTACSSEKDSNSNLPPTVNTSGDSLLLPTPLRLLGTSNEAIWQFADGNVLLTMGGGIESKAVGVDFRELDPATVPRLPHGFSAPVRMFEVEIKGSEGLETELGTAYLVTLAVRINKDNHLVGDLDLQDLVPLRYDESLSAWVIAPFSLDHPWLRVEASSNTLGIFAVALDEIPRSGVPYNPTLTPATGPNAPGEEFTPGQVQSLLPPESIISVSFPNQLPRPSPSPVPPPPVTPAPTHPPPHRLQPRHPQRGAGWNPIKLPRSLNPRCFPQGHNRRLPVRQLPPRPLHRRLLLRRLRHHSLQLLPTSDVVEGICCL